jgi:hypothetical protein
LIVLGSRTEQPIQTILSFAAFSVATPILDARAGPPIINVIIYLDVTCSQLTIPIPGKPIPPMVNVVVATPGTCYNVDHPSITIERFSSFVSNQVPSTLEPGMICELRAFYDKSCSSKAAITTNFKLERDVCYAVPLNPIVEERFTMPFGAGSFMPLCCKSADGKICDTVV